MFIPMSRINNIPGFSSIGSDNGLALTRQQAIIWTNDGKFTDGWRIYASLGLNELTVNSLATLRINHLELLTLCVSKITANYP